MSNIKGRRPNKSRGGTSNNTVHPKRYTFESELIDEGSVCVQYIGNLCEWQLAIGDDFKPEEIKITQTGNAILIEGNSEQEDETAEFSHSIEIPNGISITSLESCALNSNGVLRIQAGFDHVAKTISNSSNNRRAKTKLEEDESAVKPKKSITTTTEQEQKFRIPKGLGLKADVVLTPIVDTTKIEDSTDDVQDITKRMTYESDRNKFEVAFDFASFAPEEIEVRILKNMIEISAEQKSADGNSVVNRFYKKFTLPPGVQHPERIQAKFTTNGMLKLYSGEEDAIVHGSGKQITQKRTIVQIPSQSPALSRQQPRMVLEPDDAWKKFK